VYDSRQPWLDYDMMKEPIATSSPTIGLDFVLNTVLGFPSSFDPQFSSCFYVFACNTRGIIEAYQGNIGG
jgi:hypothetical protein